MEFIKGVREGARTLRKSEGRIYDPCVLVGSTSVQAHSLMLNCLMNF